ncbi:MAG: hypothetical protein EOO05_06700 [Chitinophagaceae bacterium]|nr:MAG: hypothetical protein EOO05_06700 [Chitinophagaceae bacterium]
MGKWIFISLLLVIFSDLSAGRSCVSPDRKTLATVEVKMIHGQASFSNAGRPVSFPRLVCGHLVLQDAGFHQGQLQILQPRFQLNNINCSYECCNRKQIASVEPVLKDHFHHLFPFFHFW